MDDETTGDAEVVEVNLDLDSALNEALRSATPNQLREIKRHVGKGLLEIDELDVEDALQVVSYLRHRATNPDLTWEEAGDLSPFDRLDT